MGTALELKGNTRIPQASRYGKAILENSELYRGLTCEHKANFRNSHNFHVGSTPALSAVLEEFAN